MPAPFYRRAAAAAAALLAACSADQSTPFAPTSATAARAFAACTPAPPDSIITLPIAPPAKRVDLVMPVFTTPTAITNPLFPISHLERAVLVGLSDGTRFRAETTLLPDRRVLQYEGGNVTVLTSQYVAFLDGRLHEVALDWYAQDDDGAVWYFGEDVANYEDGKIDNTEGTWVSCVDGPPAMIMPGTPRVGQVFRVENIWPKVFEEVEVTAVQQVVPGPRGPVAGAITVNQLHLDGTYAPKIFAPDYGEFSTGSGNNFESLAVASPTDRVALGVPSALRDMLAANAALQPLVAAGDWAEARRAAARSRESWRAYRATGMAATLLAPLMQAAVDAVARAVQLADPTLARQAAIDAEHVTLDLLVRHAALDQVDRFRLETLARQLALDVGDRDLGGSRGTLVTVGLVLDRQMRLPAGLAPALRAAVTTGIAAADRGDVETLRDVARTIESLLQR